MVPESRALLGNAGADDVAAADPLGIADSARSIYHIRLRYILGNCKGDISY